MKKKIKLQLFFAILFTAMFSFTAITSFATNSEDYNINIDSLFMPKAGSQGNEKAVTAKITDGNLPAWMAQQEQSGALVYLNKKTSSSTSAIISRPFAISDNTKTIPLIKFRPTPSTNKYLDLIKGKGSNGKDIDAATAHADTSYHPDFKNFSVIIRDAENPNIFIEAFWEWREAGGTQNYLFGDFRVRANNQVSAAERSDNNLRLQTASGGGALVPVSYLGSQEDIMQLYYDYNENKMYTYTCDTSGKISSEPMLIRDFNSTYGEKDNAWSGFESKFVTVEISYQKTLNTISTQAKDTSLNNGYAALIHNIDGVDLSTDSLGNISQSEVARYNNLTTSYKLNNQTLDFNEGLKTYKIPSLKISNLLQDGENCELLTANFEIKAFNSNNTDITSDTITGLNNGKWTVDTIFTPVESDKYTILYKFNDLEYKFEVPIKNSVTTDSLFEYDLSKIALQFDKIPPVFMTGNAGLGINLSSDTSLNYTLPIKLSSLNSDTPLISYLITPQTKKNAVKLDEIKEIIFTITDSQDSSKYIKIKHIPSIYDINVSFISVAANGQSFGALRTNGFELENRNGTPLDAAFSGFKSSLANIYYYNNSIYAGKALNSNYNAQIRDFNNPEHLLGSDKIFEGFSSDYANLSVEFKGTIQPTSIIMYSIAGQQLVGEKINDITAPDISVNNNFYEPNTPIGEVSKQFKIPSFIAFDNIDLDITENATVKVFKNYFEETKTEYEVVSGYFTPNSAGVYSIVISVADSGLNFKEHVVEVQIVDKIDELNLYINGSIESKSTIGNTVDLPELVVEGGSGNYITSIMLITPNDQETVIEGLQIALEAEGTYTIIYSAIDWLGTTASLIKNIKCSYPIDSVLQYELSYSDNKAIFKMLSSDIKYQVWLYSKFDNIDNIEHWGWLLKVPYTNGANQFAVDGLISDNLYNDVYNLYVRAKDDNGEIKDFNLNLSKDILGQIYFKSVAVNSDTGNELYLSNLNQDIVLDVKMGTAQPDYIQLLEDNIPTEVNFENDKFIIKGASSGYHNYKVVAVLGNQVIEKAIKVFVYDSEQENMIITEIKSNKAAYSGSLDVTYSITLEMSDGSNFESSKLEVYADGQKLDVKLKSIFANKHIYEAIANYSSHGIRHIYAYSGSKTEYTDYSDIYCYSSSRGGSLNVEVNDDSSGLYSFNAKNAIINGLGSDNKENDLDYEFAYYLEDSAGWSLIRNYSAVSELNWKSYYSGTYKFVVRVKRVDSPAKTYELEKSFEVKINSSHLESSNLSINIFDIDEKINVSQGITNKPYLITAEYSGTEEVLYRFTVTSQGKSTVYLNRFSPDGKLYFIPGNNNTYVITVRVISSNSYGYKEILSQTTFVSH